MAWCEGVRGLTRRRARRRAREACLGGSGLADNWARPRWVDSVLGWPDELGRRRIPWRKAADWEREKEGGEREKKGKKEKEKEKREYKGGLGLKTRIYTLFEFSKQGFIFTQIDSCFQYFTNFGTCSTSKSIFKIYELQTKI